MDARSVLLMVNGHNKASALRHGVEGGIRRCGRFLPADAPEGNHRAPMMLPAENSKCRHTAIFKDIEKDNLDPSTQLR